MKCSRSTKESYGDNAIGYVQLKRKGPICTIKGKITAEHKIHKHRRSMEKTLCLQIKHAIVSSNRKNWL